MLEQTDPLANEPDLFDVAALLAGCQPIELLRVYHVPSGLAVELLTGQRIVFSLADIAGQFASMLRGELTAVIGQPAPDTPPADVGAAEGPRPDPAPDTPPAKAPKARKS